MATNKIEGVITALVTPFKNGEVDFPSFSRLIRAQLDGGVQGFVINGTTGESPTLSFSEVKELYDFAKAEVNGAASLIVGTGGNSTAKTLEFTREASSWNPEAVLIVVPYYNKPPQRGLFLHFKEIARASEVPVILYNVPSRTVAGLEAETVGMLSGQPNIVGIKEASGNMELLGKMQEATDPKFIFLSGDDGSSVEFCKRGGAGVISVCSHVIPAEMVDFIKRSRESGVAEEFSRRYSKLMKWLYVEANPIPVKMALYEMGLISSPELRLPLMHLDEKYHEDLRACLKELGKI